MVDYSYAYDPMGNSTQRAEDSGVSAYTYNNLNQLVTGDWSGPLSAFGWAETADLGSVSVDGQAATVLEQGGPAPPAGFAVGSWTAKELTVPQGDTTLTDGRWSYTWNDENRLVSAEEPPMWEAAPAGDSSSPTTAKAVAAPSTSTPGTPKLKTGSSLEDRGARPCRL